VTDRFTAVDAAARRAFGAKPVWRFFVPGRLEVFGKHTDYAGGRSLVAAVPRGFAVAALPGDGRRVVVVDTVSGERSEYDGCVPARQARSWHRYVATVVRRLAANFPAANLSTCIAFASDLPRAAGISSSSALVIAIAEALVARAELEADPVWRSAIRRAEDRAAYFGCIENGASFGPLGGDEGVGTHGGSEDHAAILLGRAGCLQQCSFAPLRVDRRVRMPEGWTFVIATSGVHASKTGGARADYNRLAAEASGLVSAWRTRHPGDGRTLGELARGGDLGSFDVPPKLAARLQQFVAEDARVPEAAAALERGDVARVGELAAHSQRDAERCLRNQIPETIDLASIARGLGAAAASAFGAGWGGSVWALVPLAEAEDFLNRWQRAYRVRYPRRDAAGFVSAPGDGVLAGPSRPASAKATAGPP
jgi:galactokinase